MHEHPQERMPAAQLQAWVEILGGPVAFSDAGSEQIRFCNAAWRSRFGEPPASATWRAVFASFGEAAVASMREAMRTGTWFDCMLDGQGRIPRWHRVDVQSVRTDGGDGLLWTCVDIDDLKKAASRLEAPNVLQHGMLDLVQDCIKLISPDGRLLMMNRAGCRALGIPADSPLGMEWLSLLGERSREPGDAALVAARDGVATRFVGYSEGADGMRAWDNALTPIHGAGGKVASIACVSREVTRDHAATEALRLNQERLLVATRMGGLGVWDYDIEHDVLCCDETWHAIVGADPAVRPVRCLADFVPYVYAEDVERVCQVRETAADLIAQDRDYAVTFRIVRPDGTLRWVRSAACLSKNAHGVATRAVGFILDVTESLHDERALRDANRFLVEERDHFARQSQEDPLTRIPNRRALDQELARVCARVDRGAEAVVVGMIDIDYFKRFNDRYGHLHGDEMLCRVAWALKAASRSSDFVARYGGEEFAFILESAQSPEVAVERLLDAITRLDIPHDDSPHGRITASCGAVVADGASGWDADRLLRSADAMLYIAKSTGRNRYLVRPAEGPPHDAGVPNPQVPRSA